MTAHRFTLTPPARRRACIVDPRLLADHPRSSAAGTGVPASAGSTCASPTPESSRNGPSSGSCRRLAADGARKRNGGLPGLLPRAEQRLDRPGRRLRVRLTALRQREAAVAASGSARSATSARRIGAPATPAARSAWIAAAVSFESALPPARPREAAALRLRGEDRLHERRRRLLACGPQREHAPDRLVHEHAGAVAAQPREHGSRRPSRRGQRAQRRGAQGRRRLEPSVGRARRNSSARARSGAEAAGGDEPERGPGGESRVRRTTLLGEAAVRALAAREVRRGARGRPGRTGSRPGRHGRGERPPAKQLSRPYDLGPRRCARGGRARVAAPARPRAPARGCRARARC